jgi:hypothetical protein
LHTAISRSAAGLGAVALVATVSACSSSAKKAPTSTSTSSSTSASTSASETSSAPAPSSSSTIDYKSLLLTAADVPVPGVTEGTPAAPPQGKGATVAFTASGNRTLGDNVIVFDSAAQATSAAAASVNAAKAQVKSAEVTAAPIGNGGTAIRGTASTGAVALLIWREGRAVIVLEFDSPANDPVPTSLIQTIAIKQDQLVKTGLPA